jgi:serine kinase of HPr protein (carbohydrate metabolism regulator)
MILHGGLVAGRGSGLWRGALIEGPSGSGKSDLSLRLIESGFRLVSDDRTVVWTSAGKLFGRAPDPLAGLIEARGLGVFGAAPVGFCEVVLIVRCEPPGAPVERLPYPETESILELSLPVLRLAALEASAPAKLRRALSHLGVVP